ncbi:MAG: F0F1 ATP synthase subunit B [Deltaproteobacteria bacterium]|jgi:F-type H+-transporting ATPase subunit b|nr:F0F1 ATP synthase subunit B [Deltaproteobacteria bacterium]
MIPMAYNNWKRILWWAFITLMLANAAEALAAEASANWRPTYDMVMRWLNFGILVLLFFKYARKPLAAFLKGRSRQIEEHIKSVEAEKETIHNRIGELQREGKEGREHLHQVRDRIVSQGELKKQQIIDDARKESQLLLESAKQKIEHEITFAREKLKGEMVDQAIDLAMQKLPQFMTDQDVQNSLKMYLDGIHSPSKS